MNFSYPGFLLILSSASLTDVYEHQPPSNRGHRFPPEIIRQAVWLYYRFCLSFRDVEDVLDERGVIVRHETIRQWCRKFGTGYARKLRRRQGRFGYTWYLDELFATIQASDGVIQNPFRVARHLLRSVNHQLLRARSFLVWHEVTRAQ